MKKAIAPMAFVPAMPLILVAVQADGGPNVAPFSMYGQLSHNPPLISVSVSKGTLTADLIGRTKRFSVNVPGRPLLDRILFCGSTSGRDTDKSQVFEVFYGTEKDLPMILECPVNLGCRLYETLELEETFVFIAEVTETYADEGCLKDDRPVGVLIDALFMTNQGGFHQMGNLLEP